MKDSDLFGTNRKRVDIKNPCFIASVLLKKRLSTTSTARIVVIRRPSGYHFVTPVWGEAYTKLYVEVAIPAQLAPGNVPSFRDVPNCRYVIYTRPEDADVIRSSPVYKRLDECIPVTFEPITDGIGVTHDIMTQCYGEVIELLENWRGASFAIVNQQTGFGEPGRGAPHGDKITCFAAHA